MHEDIIRALPAPAEDPWLGWLASPPGRYLLEWESEQIGAAVADVFGFHAVQLGLGSLDALANSRIRDRLTVFTERPWRHGSAAWAHRQWCTAPAAGGSEGAAAVAGRSTLVIDSYEHLPFADQSVDLAVLAHVLEFAQAPHRVLREVTRVLRPEGRAIVCGLNPVSLWGIREAAAGALWPPMLPARGQWIGLPRLRDWFELLGFELEQSSYGCFRPACRTERWLQRTRFLERAGDRWWPICGAVYLASAVKRVAGIRLLGPAWKRGEPRRGAVAVASPHFAAPPKSVSADRTCSAATSAKD
jgi:SAM-dependent methyltransferase